MTKSAPVIFRETIFKLHDVFRETAENIPGMPKMDVTVSEHLVLSLICMLTEDKTEGIALKTLATAMKKSPPTASELVDRLVQKGLLQRVHNPADRRAILITPTEHVRDLMNRSLWTIDALCSELMAKLTPSESSALLEGLKLISAQLDKE